MNEPEKNPYECNDVTEVIKIAEQLRLTTLDCRNDILMQFKDATNRFLVNEPMANHSTFRVGGMADLVFMPASMNELVFAFQSAKTRNVPVTVLGNGSNILVSDKGIRGLTIIIGKNFSKVEKVGDHDIVAEAGALLSFAAKFAANEKLAGMEFAAGIPGSIGGAVYMNAGAYDGCMADIVTKTQGYNPEHGELFTLESIKEHEFGYRQSYFETTGSVVLQTWLSLKPGDHDEIERKMTEFSARRKKSQPLEHPSAGSTFKRPPGDYAGRLIETAGLKGCRIGGACVSEKHAGFIINDGNATATDILELIRTVQNCVFSQHGVKMETEVRILGEW